MSRASEAWATFSAALLNTEPACSGDDRFIDDEVRPADVVNICAVCPLFESCAAYRIAARPPAGIWAGERYRKPSRHKEESDDVA